MAHIWEDRVLETSTTTGTGNFTLAGAITGYRAFSAVCSTSDTVYYSIVAVDGSGIPTGEWETGLGTYSASNTLTRTTVLESSNAGAAVNFSAGTKRVGLARLANRMESINAASDVDTATTAPASGNNLRFDGTNWVPSFGGLHRIAQSVLGSDTASIDFSSIPADYEDLLVIIQTRTTIAGNYGLVRMRFNNDSGNNYSWTRENRFGRGTGFGVSYLEPGGCAGDTATANWATPLTIEIPNYKRTTFYKTVRSGSNDMASAADAWIIPCIGSGMWSSTAAINQLTFFPDSGNFKTGTVVNLYGRA